MPFYKKLLIGLAAVAVVAAVIVGTVFYFTSGISDAATDFFATTASSGAAAGYKKAAGGFRQAVSEQDFEAAVQRLGLARFKSASWPTREMQSGQGKVVGTVTLEGDITLPATVNLVRNEAGQWQVFNFELTPPGANPGQPAEQPTAPEPSKQAPQPPAKPQVPKAAEQKIESTAQPGDSVSARIGDKDWSSSGTGMIAVALGNVLLVQTTPSVQRSDIDLTTLKLQFDATSLQEQTLARDCNANGPCIELSRDSHEFLIDRASKQPALLRITKVDGNAIEGTFSADMESLDGKATIRDGHFHVTLKP
ncbi:MAG TPA: hypothetical protein VGV39_19915 [Mesorhizobium sp.]|jgi:hypothetical protein|uniref:hypothetical protein n=1 Tax=Mesorhizobium sp. TaxID=1871066 RepID=UPI002DDCC0DB|nr:hypothetical protein [Mesorhizobium sp.]HEV2505353.1 hypothetical protein [Mesorhizobium sp.]